MVFIQYFQTTKKHEMHISSVNRFLMCIPVNFSCEHTSNIWENKESLIGSMELPKLESNSGDLLDDLEKEFNELYSLVNERILSGENSYIKFSGKNNEKWTLPYTKPEGSSKIAFFKSLPLIILLSPTRLIVNNFIK